ncbi:hypothetical protein N7509_008660 [Penicillium cosmopolitanum]|uniref:HpcH/HpaI aldolase/citrate lyase domain-containing protein n=1 Tax=Penicillium cosmopolitanum TaxID=1131564 RepID=A0A9X0B2V8_9EURO|nr:uncharacterized protein N7509_008660 [Penicillium cosmopolitanum]KAJ5386119.1 hypothetical protein N7509_008660 [Penicillium cosmopolitanum]
MPFNTPVQSALKGPSAAFGFWLTLPSAGVAKTIIHGASESSAKFSWILVDAEHGLISDHHYYELNNAIGSEGVSPIIRVPCAEEWMIKRALDAGAHGVMTPMCHTEADAINIAKWTRYPPHGTRGYGPMFAPHSFPGVDPGADHDNGANDGLTTFVQIESRSGVSEVEKIAAVDGIDVLLIGPFDLAKQMGVTRCGEEHEAAIQRIKKAAHAAGKKAAIFCTGGEDARVRIQQGFDMVSVNTDVGVIRSAMVNELKVANGESVQSGPGGY